MKRTIYIGDCGTGTKLTIERGGKLTVIYSGGCPAEELLAGIRNYTDSDKLAAVVLGRWMDGYDGSPRENGLNVRVEDEDGATIGTARA